MNATTQTKTCLSCFHEIDARAGRCSNCTARQPNASAMYRNVPGKIMGGVCAFLAMQLGIDATIVRVIAVASIGITGGIAFWVYALLWLLTPFNIGGRAPLAKAFDWASNLFRGSAPTSDVGGGTDL